MSTTDLRLSIRKKSWFTLIVVLVLAVLVFAVSKGANVKSDWSDNQTSSLSASTKQVLAQLDEPIQIKAYFTADLPQPYGQLKQYVEDKLSSYHEAGRGNVGFEMINPDDDPNVAASLAALNIPKVQVQVVEDDRAQVRQAYLAIVIEYLDKQEMIPVVQTDVGFEYLLTRKIKKISGKGKQTMAVATGFGASDLSKLTTLQQLLQDDYDFVEVELDKEGVPAEAKALIVDGLDQQPSEAFRYRLDQFRMTGAGVLVLAANAEPQLSQGFSVLPTDAYANVWLHDDLGVSVEPGMVMDKQASRISVNQRQGNFQFRSVVDYPFISNVVDINENHAMTQGLEGVSMAFAAPLLWVNPDEHKSVLLTSSAWSAVQAGPTFDVDPLVDMRERFQGLSLSPQALMLAQDGVMKSAFANPPAGVSLEVGQQHLAQTENGRLLISGSAPLLDNEFIDGGNTVLILNMLDWLSHDEALIELRSRGVSQRPLEPLGNAERTFFKMFWIFGLPILVLMFAAGRWLGLRKRRALA
ncbi:MAG: hypothetical protein AUK35_03240 [Zetaproteobacteria bacterium CG2_30_46_52]|nr:MAG: hypothetical protein AUK35_03240 [Zetaproteobacteria bacterium CG2_30_46_52]